MESEFGPVVQCPSPISPDSWNGIVLSGNGVLSAVDGPECAQQLACDKVNGHLPHFMRFCRTRRRSDQRGGWNGETSTKICRGHCAQQTPNIQQN